MVITLAAASISRLRQMGKNQELLKLRERCYGITWNSTEASLEKGQGALDGSIDKWIEIIQYVAGLTIDESKFLSEIQVFLLGRKPNADTDAQDYLIDLAPLVRALARCRQVFCPRR
jgi:hypothetical protein